jgi:DNA integrity scanning protein DisA with diadenylate cyclase activity
MNLDLVKQAVRLQNQINSDIETLGKTTLEKADQLDNLIGKMNEIEEDLFINYLAPQLK